MPGPLPTTPTNFIVQSGNGQVYLSWDNVVNITSYNILRSTDNVTFTQIANQLGNSYYDTSAVVGTLYYYEVQSVNANGTSYPTAPYSVTCVNYGQVSLGQVRQASKQRADMINSDFVTTQEWNSYINHSYTELYDILVQVYGDDYYVASPYQFTTDGRVPSLYPLPDDLYKLTGVDLALSQAQNGYLTLKKFSFANRNKYIYGNTPVSFYGFIDMRYRLVGSNIELIPQPSANQQIRLWYIPRPTVLLADSDILDGISGWDEYVIVDAAIKALQKEESDVSVLLAQKAALRQRIEAAASNRDAGMPEQVTDVQGLSGYWNVWGGGPTAGWSVALIIAASILLRGF
jgi:hypothetical protein